jgi:hypothetical protein
MLPTFIIAGAGRCGTTSLSEYLGSHPEVCMACIKEPNFFTKVSHLSTYANGLDWYKSLFQVRNKGKDGAKSIIKAYGEASSSYMSCEDSPALIYQTVPEVKLIFILRDPIERMYSHFWWEQALLGRKLPDFAQMVRERHPFIQRLLYDSSYHLLLSRFLEYFPTEQVRVLLFEDMSQNPRGFIRDVYQYIGVDLEYIPSNLGKHFNASPQPKTIWLQKWLWKFNVITMKMKLPVWQLSILKKARNKLWQVNITSVKHPPIAREIRQELLTGINEAIDFVENYLQRPLPGWRRG